LEYFTFSRGARLITGTTASDIVAEAEPLNTKASV
jgi:hypothetical protein